MMKRQQRRRWRALLALAAALSLIAAACADDDDDDAAPDDADDEEVVDEEPVDDEAEVTVFGPEVEEEQQSLEEAFDEFTAETGITVSVRGERGPERQLIIDVEGGSPPDIFMAPQPALVLELADELVPLPDDVLATVEENFSSGWTDLVTANGDVLGVPTKADMKSLVYYNVGAFEDNGYEVPETFDDFLALTDQMLADGNTPFCLGLGGGDATGWPGTDWVEDWVLRLHGPELYDQWVEHEIPFDDPDVVGAGEAVYDLWSQEGFIFGGLEAAASTPHEESGLPLIDGDCLLYRMSNFFATDYAAAGAEVSADGDVWAFYLPGSEEHPNITLTAGLYAIAFSDEPAVMETMQYIASADFANSRANNPISAGLLSPNENVSYPDPPSQLFGELLAAGDPARFDASDSMPPEVGGGTFWTAMVNITTGDQTVADAFAEVEASWPAD